MRRLALAVCCPLFMVFAWGVPRAGSLDAELPLAELPHGTDEAPAYPEAWYPMRQDFEKLHAAFEKHIDGAKHISIPVAPKEFDWKVDWVAQQAYCKQTADAIFQKPRKAQPAWPDAVAARDGVEHVYEAVGKTFPRCKARTDSTDQILQRMSLSLPMPLNRNHMDSVREGWEPQSWLKNLNKIKLGIGYFTGPSYLVEFFFVPAEELVGPQNHPKFSRRAPDAPVLQWDTSFGVDAKTGCSTDAALAGPSQDPSNDLGYIDYLPTIFLSIADELIAVEFGAYAYRNQSTEQVSKHTFDRWGRKNEKFLLVNSFRHGFTRDWALSPPVGDRIGEMDPYPDRGIHRACVINFR